MITFWVTSVGREYVLRCVNNLVERCKYPNYQVLIYESKPDNPFNTMDVFEALPCEKTIWHNTAERFPNLGWVYNLFMENTGDWFIRMDDDTEPFADPTELLLEGIELLQDTSLPWPVSHVAVESNPRICREESFLFNEMQRGMLGVHDTDKYGPLLVFTYHPGLSLVKKDLVAPWNAACHWRDVELHHMNELKDRGVRSVYLLKWWGFWGHFGTLGVDNVDRQQNTDRCNHYFEEGYYGRRPEDTWETSCKV
jgi:hypothetical protein